MLNIMVIIVILLLAGLFFLLAFRARRAHRVWIQWPGLLLSGLLGLMLLAVSAAAVNGLYKFNVAPYTYVTADLQVAGTPEQIARGEQLAYLCLDCHSSTGDLPLDGGKVNFLEELQMGVLYGSNLTPGGPLKDWSDGEIVRAVREGVDNNGRPLFGMTTEPFSHLSDDDMQALVAYLRSQPAVDRSIPERNPNILAALVVGAGLAPTAVQPPVMSPISAPLAGTPEYGQYLIYTSGCRDCHGLDLTGGTNPFIPKGPNLTLVMPNHSEEQFMTFIRTGTNATGRVIDTASMPWQTYNLAFSDADLRDMYSYLRGLPAAETAK
jgi:mono/diheme cytochrome c family protein